MAYHHSLIFGLGGIPLMKSSTVANAVSEKVAKPGGLPEPVLELAKRVYHNTIPASLSLTGGGTIGRSGGGTIGRSGGGTIGRRKKSKKDQLPFPPTKPQQCVEEAKFLSIETAAIMRKLLWLWSTISPEQIERLRTNLQEDKAVLTYVCPDPAHLWTLAGLELMEVLERMGERVAAMGLKCGERRLHQLANVFGEMRHPETVFSHFRLDAQEQETLFCFMQEEVEKLGDVRSCMERLNTLRSLLRKKKPAPATSLLSELQAVSADTMDDGSSDGKGEPEKESDSSSWMPRCDLPGAEEILKLTATISELQSRCLWSVELDHVVRLLVLAIILLRDRIISVFAINVRSSDALTREDSLGRAGLALRYAKVINLAEKLMKYPFMAAGNTRDELYGLLTYNTKKDLALRLSKPVASTKCKDTKTKDAARGKNAENRDADEDKDEEDEEGGDDDDDQFTWLKKPSPLNDPRG
ncbi:hypothetical protein CLOP_g1034, partial [Closterium sp. NIES-67]